MQTQAVNIWSLLLILIKRVKMASFKEYLNQLCFDCISRLFERKCGADLSWYRFDFVPNCLVTSHGKCLCGFFWRGWIYLVAWANSIWASPRFLCRLMAFINFINAVKRQRNLGLYLGQINCWRNDWGPVRHEFNQWICMFLLIFLASSWINCDQLSFAWSRFSEAMLKMVKNST